MKMTMEIQGHKSGQSARRGSGQMMSWASIWGNDTNNRHAYVKLYGETAEALNKKLASLLDEGEVVSSKRFVITCEGEWKSDEFQKDGKIHQNRFFHAVTFNVLDGPALESARLRRDAMNALKKAEDFRKNGQIALAYEATAQFVANFAGVPLDLEQFLQASAAEDAEFGAVARDHNPEADAADHFARMDAAAGISPKAAEPRLTEVADVSEKQAHAEEQAMDIGASDEDAPMDFAGDADPELGDVGEIDDVREEDAINIEAAANVPENDVLDDMPTAPAVEEVKKPAFAVSRAPAPSSDAPRFRSASGAASAPGSKPFNRPELARPAPQPTARIAEEARPQQKAAVTPPFLRR
jgi:hypothetical protein